MQVNNQTPTAYTLTKKSKIIKAAFSAALPLVYYSICFLLGVSSIIWVLPLTFLMAIGYTVPLFINQSKIKKGNYLSVKPFIVSDLLFGILPSVLTTFGVALGLYIFVGGIDRIVFMFAIIISAIFVVVNLYFWFSYYINNTVIKRIFKDI